MDRRIGFWSTWIATAAAFVAAFGLALVVAPRASQRAFAWLYFGAAGSPVPAGPAERYVMFAFAVLGAVMAGWATVLVVVALGSFRRGEPGAWLAVAISLIVWFVPDTAYSLGSGFWQNAVLNVALAALFVVPLAATYGAFRRPSEPARTA